MSIFKFGEVKVNNDSTSAVEESPPYVKIPSAVEPLNDMPPLPPLLLKFTSDVADDEKYGNPPDT